MSNKDKTKKGSDSKQPGADQTSPATELSDAKKAAPEPSVDAKAATGETAAPEAATQSAAKPDAGSKEATAIEAQRAQTPPKKPSAGKASTGNGGGMGRLLMGLLLLLILGGLLAAAGYVLQQELDKREQAAEARLGTLHNQLAQSQERLAVLNRQHEQLRQGQAEQQQQWATRLTDIEKALSHQRNRLRALSTTTREDWLLAEAEYLLKLANQRVLIERSTSSALGLMEEADRILRDLDDPDLAPVRRALARDLTAVKLAAPVDLEGLYFRLAALAENVHRLPTMPRRSEPAPSGEADIDGAAPATWWARVRGAVAELFSGLGHYIRVRDHAEAPRAILPPDAADYLHQNLRLMLERAQLAAMRQESALYRNSLENVIEWARRYYPESRELANFLAQTGELLEVEVQQPLPDISESLELLSDHVDRLHKVDRSRGGPLSDENPAEARQ